MCYTRVEFLARESIVIYDLQKSLIMTSQQRSESAQFLKRVVDYLHLLQDIGELNSIPQAPAEGQKVTQFKGKLGRAINAAQEQTIRTKVCN